MKGERIPFYILCFFGLAVAVYLECCAVVAFLWAGFNGFGGIWMEYTSGGETVFGIVLYVPALLLLLILALRMINHYKQKEAVKYYFYDILFCTAAIGMSFFVFYFFKEPRQTIMDSIMHAIRESGWLCYPVP